MRILALDIGDRRIGVALSDTLGILATPLTILERRDETGDIESVAGLVERHGAGRIVAGLPFSLDGGIGPQAEKVRAFVEKLEQRVRVPVVRRDERFTTLEARRLMREAVGKKPKKKVRDDAFAAAVILQGYLDEQSGKEDREGL